MLQRADARSAPPCMFANMTHSKLATVVFHPLCGAAECMHAHFKRVVIPKSQKREECLASSAQENKQHCCSCLYMHLNLCVSCHPMSPQH